MDLPRNPPNKMDTPGPEASEPDKIIEQIELILAALDNVKKLTGNSSKTQRNNIELTIEPDRKLVQPGPSTSKDNFRSTETTNASPDQINSVQIKITSSEVESGHIIQSSCVQKGRQFRIIDVSPTTTHLTVTQSDGTTKRYRLIPDETVDEPNTKNDNNYLRSEGHKSRSSISKNCVNQQTSRKRKRDDCKTKRKFPKITLRDRQKQRRRRRKIPEVVDDRRIIRRQNIYRRNTPLTNTAVSEKPSKSSKRRLMYSLLHRINSLINCLENNFNLKSVVITSNWYNPREKFLIYGTPDLRRIIERNHKLHIIRQCRKYQLTDIFLDNETILPPLSKDGRLVSLSQLRFHDLRNIIPYMIRAVNNNEPPDWSTSEKKQDWWPIEIPWGNIRIDRRSPEEKKKISWTNCMRKIVYNCYMHHGCSDFLNFHLDDMHRLVQFRNTLNLHETQLNDLPNNSEVSTIDQENDEEIIVTLTPDLDEFTDAGSLHYENDSEPLVPENFKTTETASDMIFDSVDFPVLAASNSLIETDLCDQHFQITDDIINMEIEQEITNFPNVVQSSIIHEITNLDYTATNYQSDTSVLVATETDDHNIDQPSIIPPNFLADASNMEVSEDTQFVIKLTSGTDEIPKFEVVRNASTSPFNIESNNFDLQNFCLDGTQSENTDNNLKSTNVNKITEFSVADNNLTSISSTIHLNLNSESTNADPYNQDFVEASDIPHLDKECKMTDSDEEFMNNFYQSIDDSLESENELFIAIDENDEQNYNEDTDNMGRPTENELRLSDTLPNPIPSTSSAPDNSPDSQSSLLAQKPRHYRLPLQVPFDDDDSDVSSLNGKIVPEPEPLRNHYEVDNNFDDEFSARNAAPPYIFFDPRDMNNNSGRVDINFVRPVNRTPTMRPVGSNVLQAMCAQYSSMTSSDDDTDNDDEFSDVSQAPREICAPKDKLTHLDSHDDKKSANSDALNAEKSIENDDAQRKENMDVSFLNEITVTTSTPTPSDILETISLDDSSNDYCLVSEHDTSFSSVSVYHDAHDSSNSSEESIANLISVEKVNNANELNNQENRSTPNVEVDYVILAEGTEYSINNDVDINNSTIYNDILQFDQQNAKNSEVIIVDDSSCNELDLNESTDEDDVTVKMSKAFYSTNHTIEPKLKLKNNEPSSSCQLQKKTEIPLENLDSTSENIKGKKKPANERSVFKKNAHLLKEKTNVPNAGINSTKVRNKPKRGRPKRTTNKPNNPYIYYGPSSSSFVNFTPEEELEKTQESEPFSVGAQQSEISETTRVARSMSRPMRPKRIYRGKNRPIILGRRSDFQPESSSKIKPKPKKVAQPKTHPLEQKPQLPKKAFRNSQELIFTRSGIYSCVDPTENKEKSGVEDSSDNRISVNVSFNNSLTYSGDVKMSDRFERGIMHSELNDDTVKVYSSYIQNKLKALNARRNRPEVKTRKPRSKKCKSILKPSSGEKVTKHVRFDDNVTVLTMSRISRQEPIFDHEDEEPSTSEVSDPISNFDVDPIPSPGSLIIDTDSDLD